MASNSSSSSVQQHQHLPSSPGRQCDPGSPCNLGSPCNVKDSAASKRNHASYRHGPLSSATLPAIDLAVYRTLPHLANFTNPYHAKSGLLQKSNLCLDQFREGRSNTNFEENKPPTTRPSQARTQPNKICIDPNLELFSHCKKTK